MTETKAKSFNPPKTSMERPSICVIGIDRKPLTIDRVFNREELISAASMIYVTTYVEEVSFRGASRGSMGKGERERVQKAGRGEPRPGSRAPVRRASATHSAMATGAI